MKKPKNLTPGNWRTDKKGDWYDVISDHDFLDSGDIICQDAEEANAKAIAQVPNMIDALIEARNDLKLFVLTFAGTNANVDDTKEIISKIEQVLKDAGCEV